LRISDDGRGIPRLQQDGKRYGLAMMRERAAQLRARLQIRSTETGGTEISLIADHGGDTR
jgi:two-component system nitrate/nitrite sensor histidine kinase NarX